MKTIRAVAFMLVLLTTHSLLASDWPQYLGPDRNAASGETGLLRSWPEDGPKLLWTLPLGAGFGGAAVSGGKVYVYDRVEDKTNVLRCLDLMTGKEEWTFSNDVPGKVDFNGSRSVPAVDGDKIYVCDPFGNLHCVDMKGHGALWHKNIWTDFGGENLPQWGIAQSPVVYGDVVIVASQTVGAGLVAYDKNTGDVAWKTPALPGGNAGYVSPAIVNVLGEDHLVMISAPGRDNAGGGGRGAQGGPPGSGPSSDQGAQGGPPGSGPSSGQGAQGGPPSSGPPGDQGVQGGPQGSGPPSGGSSAGQDTITEKGAVAGYDPKTGSLLWSYDGFQCRNPCHNVVALGGSRLFISGGYDAVAVLIRIEKEGEGYTAKELMTSSDFGTFLHPAVYYDGYLYGTCTTSSARDGLVCMDLEGNVKWKTKKKPLFDKGGSILADGMIIINDGEGMFYLVEATPEGFKALSEAQLLDSKEAWAPLAIGDGKLVVRDQNQLKCFLVKSSAG